MIIESGEKMGYGINANPQGMKALGSEVISIAQEYQNNVKRIYQIIDNISSNWSGVDSQQYVAKTNEHRPNIEALGTAIKEYGELVTLAGKNFEAAQEQLKNQASRL